MDKTKIKSSVAELIDMCRATSLNESFQPDHEFLRRHDFSPAQWKCFVDLIRDLDLNESGVKIMLEEIRAGRYTLMCDRNDLEN